MLLSQRFTYFHDQGQTACYLKMTYGIILLLLPGARGKDLKFAILSIKAKPKQKGQHGVVFQKIFLKKTF